MTLFWNWFDGAPLWVAALVVLGVYMAMMIAIDWMRWR